MPFSYYCCKECCSRGSIERFKVGKCPVCGSNHINVYKSEFDYLKRSGYEKCNEA